MTMEYGFNEILLVKFITKYFSFDVDHSLITQGYTFMTQLIDELIAQDRNIQNLKHKDMKQVINSVLGEYSYRFGGINECLAAFGNFSYSLDSQSISSQSQSSKISNHEQIRKIIPPIKDQLLKVSYFLQQLNQYSTLTEEQTVSRKIDFLKTIFKIHEPIVVEKKQRKKRTNKKIQNGSVGTRSTFGGYKTSCDLQTSIKTQADQWTITSQMKLPKPIKTSTGTSTPVKNVQIKQNHQLLLKFEPQEKILSQSLKNEDNNWPSKGQNKLVIRYEDFFPLQQVQILNKKSVKRQKQKQKKESKKVYHLID